MASRLPFGQNSAMCPAKAFHGPSQTATDDHARNRAKPPVSTRIRKQKVVARTGIEPVTPGFSVLSQVGVKIVSAMGYGVRRRACTPGCA